MVKKIILCITLYAIICSVTSIYLHTKHYKNEYCMSKQIDDTEEITISYIITGDSDEEKVDVKLNDPQKKIVFERKNESGGEHKHVSTESGIYVLCFYVPKPGENYVSLEFFTNYEKGHTVDMAKDRSIDNLKSDVNKISNIFEEIEKNIRFIMDRRYKHTEVLHSIVSSIRNLSFFKIFLIIILSFIQVFLIKKFMGTNKSVVSNNPFFDISGGI